jgi:fumarylacetoacetase
VSSSLDQTHDPALRSWVLSAQAPDGDFPIQNLPHGVFRRAGSSEPWRGGIAIGDQILDLQAALWRDLFTPAVRSAAEAAARAPLNDFMALPRAQRRALRHAVSALLAASQVRTESATECLVPQHAAAYALPARVENFSDFYSSLSHATNVGRQFRPDNPVLPNYRWLPVGYHGRTSSLRVSGVDVMRPSGQLKAPDKDQPVFGPCRRLDYETELGWLVGPGNDLGAPIPIAEVDEHLFGIALLNDWSARDIQAWEYQPLGPFLAKSFFTSLAPWVVTLDALEPFRQAFARPACDPEPLPHLWSKAVGERGAFDIRVDTLIQSKGMREAGLAPLKLSTSHYTDAYWAPAQIVAHQTSNGTNLCPGDLLGSGTLSGPDPSSRACLLEITEGGKTPLSLPSGESRSFLEDGDTVLMQGHCARKGYVRIGFGECRATVLAARPI